MKILGFIPARTGSKGIKNKNFVKFNGKPLILSTINFSKKLKLVTPFVSTNSSKILNYTKKNSIKFNYMRPPQLSSDKSNIIDAVFHALDWFKKKRIYFDAVMLLQPTSPIRKKTEINQAIDFFVKKNVDSLASISVMKEHPFECLKLRGNKWSYLEKNTKEKYGRQSYKDFFYFIDGSFYLSKVNFLKKYKKFVIENKTKLFKISQYPGIDIDNPIDLKIAELFRK